MTDAQRIREACNAENNPELPEGCMYPWCVCNRYPEGSMTRIETPDKDISLLREALEILAGPAEHEAHERLVRSDTPVTIRCQLGDLRRAWSALSATAPKP